MDTNHITNYQIRTLRQEARDGGDDIMVAICTMALGGTPRLALVGETMSSCRTACALMWRDLESASAE